MKGEGAEHRRLLRLLKNQQERKWEDLGHSYDYDQPNFEELKNSYQMLFVIVPKVQRQDAE